VCASLKFALSDNLVRLSDIGEIVDIVRLEPSTSNTLLHFAEDIPETDVFLLANEITLRITRFGMILFDDTYEDEEEATAHFWFFQDRNTMLKVIQDIVLKVQEIFAAEKRIVTVLSPNCCCCCFIFFITFSSSLPAMSLVTCMGT